MEKISCFYPPCPHPFAKLPDYYEVDTLVAEVEEVAGVCGGRLAAEGGGGDVARQLQGEVGLGWGLLLWRTGEERLIQLACRNSHGTSG